MPEEMRFFLRTALYTAGITVIYWLVSYEWAGTVMLTFLFLAAAFFIAAATNLHRTSSATPSTAPHETARRNRLLQLVGFDPEDEEPGAPLKLEEEEFPGPSLSPLGVAVAATLVGLGLIYGAWLWIPGVSLGLATGTSWLTQA